ncbi:MAG: site-2 protease family protein [Sedimentisphaerales bacterium]|nr:site-2 protease family protein [Sedimentisphaerales bacterium]
MTYIMVILLICFLIFIHELGHFLAAKVSGIPIARFSIGFGPVLFSRKIKGTEYCISIFPLGGYVMPDGINELDDLYSIPLKKRLFYTLGGPLSNILFALFGFLLLNLIAGNISLYSIVIDPVRQTLLVMYQIFNSIGLIFKHANQLSGIIGIVTQGSEIVGMSFTRLINFGILMSVNFAVFNLLPLPPLDGGSIMIYLLGRINSKLLKIHIPLAITGWVLLLGLMLYATVLDIARISGGLTA